MFDQPENLTLLFGILWSISELLASTRLKSNSIFQLARNIIGRMVGK